MNLYQAIYILITGLIFFCIGCSEKLESTWKKKQILIDGRGSEWNEYPLQFNEDLNIVYGFVNNDSALYCIIRFADEDLARMISVRGFTLWVNNSDDKAKLLGIHYQDERLREDLIHMRRSRRGQPDQRGNQDKKVLQPRGRFLLAENDSVTNLYINNLYGLNAAAGYDKGLYCFELSIALKGFPDVFHYIDAETGNSIKVGMEIAGISQEDRERLKEEMEKRRESMGSGSGGGRPPFGMMGNGGRGGRGMPGAGPQMPDLDGEEFWITVKLAQG